MPILLGPKGGYSVQAGRFRHRVTIQRGTTSRDSAGGITITWTNFATGVPAVVEPASGKEYFLARQIVSEVDTSITIRWRPGILATMRVLHGSNVFDIIAVLPDGDSGRKTISMMCKLGGGSGFKAGA